MPVEIAPISRRSQSVGIIASDAKEFSVQAIGNGELYPVGQCKVPCNPGPGGPPPKCAVPPPKCQPCRIEALK